MVEQKQNKQLQKHLMNQEFILLRRKKTPEKKEHEDQMGIRQTTAESNIQEDQTAINVHDIDFLNEHTPREVHRQKMNPFSRIGNCNFFLEKFNFSIGNNSKSDLRQLGTQTRFGITKGERFKSKLLKN